MSTMIQELDDDGDAGAEELNDDDDIEEWTEEDVEYCRAELETS